MLVWWSCVLGILSLGHGSVLDPSLFLSPGPPLLPASGDISPGDRWNQKLETRVERDAELLVVPLGKKEDPVTEAAEEMEPSETFWRGYGEPSGLAVPLSFRVSGTYGRYAPGSSGVVADRYMIANLMPGVNVPGSLAGSGYGSYLGGYGRVYGRNPGASWSGWGNGKWGHYGKG